MVTDEFNLITPAQFHCKEFDTNKINVLLTFDDGYQSWVDVCLPIMGEYNAKGIFFINSGLLDVAYDAAAVEKYIHERLLLSNVRQPLTWEGTKALVSAGQTIGGHTVTHPNLAKLDTKEIKTEIEDDKKRIEIILDITLIDFAYPFGRKNNYTVDIFGATMKAGYTFVYTADTGFVKEFGNSNISRVCLEKNQSLQSINLCINGGYDVLKSVICQN